MKVELRDKETGNEQTIDDSGASLNIVKPLPPYLGLEGKQKMRIYRQYLKTSAGASSMLVNGSSTNVDFYVEADDNLDTYITNLSFVIADASLSLNQFGNITALTNGCRLFYQDNAGEVDIHDALKTNFQFIRLCGGVPSFGSTTNAFIASNVSGTSEAVIPTLDLKQRFGFQWGVVLKGGTNQRITLRVRDDCSGVDQFDCIAYGFTREKD